MERSGGVTASAILTFIGSAFTLLMGVFIVVGALVASRVPMTRPTPVNLGAIMAIEALFFVGFGGWGVASGVGLLMLKQWARISVIVFSAILVFCFVPAALMMAIVPLPSTSVPNLPDNFMTVMRVGMVTFYGAFALLGGIWLYYFNRKTVREQFRSLPLVAAAAAEPPSWGAQVTVPALSVPGPPVATSRERPLSISIIAWFLLVSSGLVAVWLPLTGQFFPGVKLPLYFLGHFFFGRSTYAIMLVWMIAQFVAAIGLLKLKRAGLVATIALQCLAVLNVTLLVAVPSARARYQQIMDTMVATMSANMPQFDAGSGAAHAAVPPFRVPVWGSIWASIPLVLVILWFLITRRHAFTPSGDARAGGNP